MTIGLPPTFIGLGPARCGSTWLHKRLALHPEVHVSDPKQLVFFNERILDRDLAWYYNHFAPAEGEQPKPVRGEVTPFYARLQTNSVRNIQRLLPEARIIMTIRNPVDRIWSNARMDFGFYRNRALDSVSTGTFLRHFLRARTRRYTEYEKIIDRWSNVYGEEALHISVFDNIKTDPVSMLCDVFAHIGADTSWQPAKNDVAPAVIPEGDVRKAKTIPDEVRWFLSAEWLDSTRRLNDRMNGRVSTWVQSMEDAVEHPRTLWRLRRAWERGIGAMPERCAYLGYDWILRQRLARRWKVIHKQAEAYERPRT